MTRRRWIADEFSDDRAVLTGAHAAHLSRTLRARVGQEFEVACGDCVRQATVASVTDDRVEFTLGEDVTASKAVPITLVLAIFKFDRMEWAIEKCTELNVTTIVPIVARRTEKHLAVAAPKRVERWRRIVREAAEQSRRTSPPEIREPLKLKDALGLEDNPGGSGRAALQRRVPGPPIDESQALAWRHSADLKTGGLKPHDPITLVGAGLKALSTREHSIGNRSSLVQGTDPRRDLKVVLAETERQATLSEILRAHEDVKSLALAVGPEGGWSADELQLFDQSHWIAASLGDTILRAETAAIAALAIARSDV